MAQRTPNWPFLTLAFPGNLGILVKFIADFLQGVPEFRLVFIRHLNADLGEPAFFIGEGFVARFIQAGNQPLDIVFVGKSADDDGAKFLLGFRTISCLL